MQDKALLNAFLSGIVKKNNEAARVAFRSYIGQKLKGLVEDVRAEPEKSGNYDQAMIDTLRKQTTLSGAADVMRKLISGSRFNAAKKARDLQALERLEQKPGVTAAKLLTWGYNLILKGEGQGVIKENEDAIKVVNMQIDDRTTGEPIDVVVAYSHDAGLVKIEYVYRADDHEYLDLQEDELDYIADELNEIDDSEESPFSDEELADDDTESEFNQPGEIDNDSEFGDLDDEEADAMNRDTANKYGIEYNEEVGDEDEEMDEAVGCEYMELSSEEVDEILGSVEPDVKMLLQTALDQFYLDQRDRNEDLFSELVHSQIGDMGIEDDAQIEQIDQAATMLFNALFPNDESDAEDFGDEDGMDNFADTDDDLDDLGDEDSDELEDGEGDTAIDFATGKVDTEFMELAKHDQTLLALAADVYESDFNAIQQEALLTLLDDIEANAIEVDNFDDSVESIRSECCVSAEELERFDAFLDKIKAALEISADEQRVTD